MRALWGIILLAIASGGTPSQNPPAKDSETPFKVDVDVVNVLCTVYDKHGGLVQDLNRGDFEIREDGQRQDLRYFARDTDLPLTVALMVDVSGSVRAWIDTEKDAAAKFLQAVIRPSDQAMLVGFSSTIILWQDMTPSVERLNLALGRLRPIPFRGIPLDGSPMPGTLLYDAVGAAAREKLAKISGRKVVVVISDGLDNGSASQAEEAVAAVQSANAIVYGICYDTGFSGCSFLKGLAEPTGGRMFEAGKKTPLSQIFQIIEQELRSQYALGYVPTNRARDGTFRKLQVRVKGHGLRVQARKGYFAAHEAGS
jgi:VWFA-related protein